MSFETNLLMLPLTLDEFIKIFCKEPRARPIKIEDDYYEYLKINESIHYYGAFASLDEWYKYQTKGAKNV